MRSANHTVISFEGSCKSTSSNTSSQSQQQSSRPPQPCSSSSVLALPSFPLHSPTGDRADRAQSQNGRDHNNKSNTTSDNDNSKMKERLPDDSPASTTTTTPEQHGDTCITIPEELNQLPQLRRIGRPNVYRKETLIPIPIPVQRPSTSISVPITTECQVPAAPSQSQSTLSGDSPNPNPSTATAIVLHQHPFRTAAATANANSSYQARYQAKPKSPMDSNFRFLTPYIIGTNWSSRTATTFMVSKSPAKTSILKTCQQLQPVPINIIFDNLRKIEKIGEGVFGEVYTGHFTETHPSTSLTASPRVYKVVPIEGDKIVNQERQKRYGEIEPEIIVSRRLNVLLDDKQSNFTEGFAKLTAALVCRGSYPRVLASAWKKYQKDEGSDNDLPVFKDNQEYVVLESELYGRDVESYTFTNAKQALSLLLQVTHTLGVGEAGVKFEHRDLHWGNILAMTTTKPFIRFKLNGILLQLPSCGIKSTIIDFTIASTENHDGQYIYTDMSADEDQFNGDEDYQFEIYRMMRQELENDWTRFAPRNNIYWMHYLADKLVKRARYSDKKSRIHRKYMARLRYFKGVIKEYESCAQFALSYPEEEFLHLDSDD